MARLLAVLATMLFAAGAAAAPDRPRVVAVNYALAYIAERLLGDAAEVVYPVPDGTDPSFWRPSIADISAIQSADLILLNGAGFATWTAKVSLPRSKLVDTSRGLADRLIATETVTHSHGDGGEHSHEGTASYTWLDPEIALRQAQAVANALKARGLEDEGRVDDRLALLAADLAALDAAADEALGALSTTVFVATHPRYQYLARAYGLTILSLEWEAGAAPTGDELAELRQLVAERGAEVLIWEAEPPEGARAAIAELGLQDAVFPPLAVEPPAADFVAAFAAGIEAIAAAASRAESG
ncbi:MAG: metal ABC transporter substrate-binding protein [Paracoccaceae bacterium]|nr:metal ABC transporter substrate-binding protein [Paracoccaceae bacterium]